MLLHPFDLKAKVILLITPLLLLSCAATSHLQSVSEGQIIDMGPYSVKAPLGDGWEAEVKKEQGTINFIRPKKKALGISGGTTVVTVFLNVVFPNGWHLSEEEVADNYRNMEEQGMIEKGVKTGIYRLEDVKKALLR